MRPSGQPKPDTGKPAKAQIIARTRARCIHLGVVVERPACGCAVHGCSVYGKCLTLPNAALPDLPDCATCRSYVPREAKPRPPLAMPAEPPAVWVAYKAALAKRFGFAPAKPKARRGGYTPSGPDADGWQRHLLYFVYPLAGNGVWQRNLDQLKRRLDMFNGERWLAIATPSERVEPNGVRHVCDTARAVVDYFGAGHANYLVMPHPKRKLGEVVAFSHLWDQVKQYVGPRDVTFYGHTKGVTKPVDNGISVHRWADLMYAANLDHWPDVAELLTTYSTVGAFKKLGWFRGDTRRVRWHYHGTFFWARNADVFARDWRKVANVYGGTEMWPGTLFADNESACIFYSFHDSVDIDMYSVPESMRADGCLKLWPWPHRNMTRPEMLADQTAFVEALCAAPS